MDNLLLSCEHVIYGVLEIFMEDLFILFYIIVILSHLKVCGIIKWSGL